MNIDKEYAKGLLNKYADIAMEIYAIKKEIIAERDLDNDDKWPWRDQETVKTFLNFGMTRLLDEAVCANGMKNE